MIDKLKEKIINTNNAYRIGKPIMSDAEYDLLIEQLADISPDDELLAKVGHSISDESRKVKLPIDMASMSKLKSMDAISDWCRLKGIPSSEYVVITPKFDGLSLCVNEDTSEAITRGDGVFGQKSDEHYSFIQNHLNLEDDPFKYTYGEVIMPKQVFIDKYSSEFANPRNLVAGLLNAKEPTDALKDCQYIKYGAITKKNFKTKQEILNVLNAGQAVKVQFYICKISDLTEDLLIQLFHKYSTDYEIDGLIIEVNDLSLQEKLGRETSSNNPVWARAYKSPIFEQSAETEVLDIEWNISKNSLLKPVAIVKPINLNGVVVSRCTLNNARFVKDMGIGKGSIVVIRRSGLVIPKIVEVIKTVDFVIPSIEGLDIVWNENGIELITLTENDSQKLKSIISFFEILNCDNVGSGVVSQLYNFGYKTIKDILSLNISDLEKLDGFGKRKATIIFNSIQKSIKNVKLSKLQHATNIFVGIGSKKLDLLEHFKKRPTIEQVMQIDGFAEISAKIYVENYDKFFDFIKDLPITIEEKVEVTKTSNDLEGMVVAFTGIRLKNEEYTLTSRGGKISSSISKYTTHLVCKDPNSGSSKLEKAKSLGVKVISVEDFLKIIN